MRGARGAPRLTHRDDVVLLPHLGSATIEAAKRWRAERSMMRWRWFTASAPGSPSVGNRWDAPQDWQVKYGSPSTTGRQSWPGAHNYHLAHKPCQITRQSLDWAAARAPNKRKPRPLIGSRRKGLRQAPSGCSSSA